MDGATLASDRCHAVDPTCAVLLSRRYSAEFLEHCGEELGSPQALSLAGFALAGRSAEKAMTNIVDSDFLPVTLSVLAYIVGEFLLPDGYGSST
jgi:hypothetical protein